MPGNGNGDGRRDVHTQTDDVPWEGIRSLVWELLRCRELSRCSLAFREDDGERFVTGYSEAKLTVAIDLGRFVDQLGREIGHHRQQRFLDWVGGVHPLKFRGVESAQLRSDVRRLSVLAVAGGYRFMLNSDG
jgi:hypothetical protein